MNDKVNDAISTLMRVVPTRFSGEVAVVKAEIERLKKLAHEILEEYDISERGHIGMNANYDSELASHKKFLAECRREINGVDNDAGNI